MKATALTTGWMILTAQGRPYWTLARPTRREAITAFENLMGRRWVARSRGWRCIRVLLTRAGGNTKPRNLGPTEPAKGDKTS